MSFNLGTIPAWATVAVAVVSAVFALLQLHANARARRVDRVIQLHESLTGGEVGAARDRFTTLMWKIGVSEDPTAGRAHRPTFEALVAPGPAISSVDGDPDRLSRYPADLFDTGAADPLQDLYKVLWCFERIDAARTHNTLDRQLLVNLIGFHALWWDRLLSRIDDHDSHHRGTLRDLAAACLRQRPDLDDRVKRGHQRSPLP